MCFKTHDMILLLDRRVSLLDEPALCGILEGFVSGLQFEGYMVVFLWFCVKNYKNRKPRQARSPARYNSVDNNIEIWGNLRNKK